jgi:signal transduction histidine kinase
VPSDPGANGEPEEGQVWVEVSVRDKGRGIDEADLPFIFDRFYRARSGRKGEGLGLGLHICRLLVEAQGGRIWVESARGEGSTFTFALPALAVERSEWAVGRSLKGS